MFEAILDFIDKKRRADPDPISHLRIEPRWTERPSFVQAVSRSGEAGTSPGEPCISTSLRAKPTCSPK